MPEPGRSLSTTVAVGTIWTIGLRVVDRTIGLISTVLLARLLMPQDFGLVAMAMAIVALLEALTTLGVESSLISHREPTKAHYDTAWTINFAVGTVTAAVLLLLAAPAAQFYDEPRILPVVCVVATFPLLAGLTNIGVVDFRRNLQFQRDFMIGALNKVVAFAATVPLAFLLRNYWALLAGMLVGRIAGLVQSYVMHPYRPRFSIAHLREQIQFSQWMLLGGLLVFLRTRLADFVLGKQLGAGALGLFNMGREIGTLPTSEIVAPINRAIFPGYAKIADDRVRLADGFFRVLGIIALVAIPAGAGLGVLSDLFVSVVLGARWLESAPIVTIISFFGVTMALQTNTGAVFMALRQPKLQALVHGCTVAALLPLLVVWSRHDGIRGAALAFAVSGIGSLLASYALAKQRLGVPYARFVAVLWRPVVGSIGMLAILRLANASTAPWFGSTAAQGLAKLIALVTVGAIVYLLLVAACWLATGRSKGAETELMDIVLPAVERFRARSR